MATRCTSTTPRRLLNAHTVTLTILITSGLGLGVGSEAHAWCRPGMHGCRHYPKVTIPSPECSAWKDNCRIPAKSYSKAPKVNVPAFTGNGAAGRR